MKSVLYLQIALSFPILGTIGLWVLTQSGIIAAAEIVFNLEAIYLCSVWASMLFYRVSTFHRLRDFPGPILWRLTKFTQSWENRGLRGFEALDRLHQQYGDFVRTGICYQCTHHSVWNMPNSHRALRIIYYAPRWCRCNFRTGLQMFSVTMGKYGRPTAIYLRNTRQS